MCGIAGIYQLNQEKVKWSELRRFTDTMYHRGPDGGGYELLHEDRIGFGHRRLSILDLSEQGKQPMYFKNKYCITYNGEVYNFLEIKKELLTKGHSFKTETDTEIILAAYQTWGKDAFSKFNGMWAFAIWDIEEKKLLLCRDRFGVKPLHFIYIPEKVFAFASETVAFADLDGFAKEPDEQTLLFSMQNPSALEPSGNTIYKHIKQLLPGHFMEVDPKTGIKSTRWWNTFDHLEVVPKTEAERTEKFYELFKSACKLRLRSDVAVASALSGGLDSSSVFAMVHHLSQTEKSYERLPENWKKAVVATFPGTEVDEKKYAEKVIDHLHAEVIYVEPDYSNLVTDIVSTTKLFDNLSVTPIISVTNTYKAMKRDHITVSLDGHGADELLYGYKSTVHNLFYHYLKSQAFDAAEEIAEVIAHMSKAEDASGTRKKLLETVAAVKNKNSITKFKDRIFSKSDNISVLQHPKTLDLDNWFLKDSTPYLRYDDLFEGVNSSFSYKDALLVKDFFIDHIPYNLRDFDRGAMQHGVEIRMPFMDYRLVDYCFSLSTNDKIGKGYTKLVLRNAMKDLLPDSIRLRKNKIGLGAPTSQWFNGQLSQFICDQVASTSFLQSNFWNGRIIKEFVHETCSKKNWDNNSANKFWNILNAHIIINIKDTRHDRRI